MNIFMGEIKENKRNGFCIEEFPVLNNKGTYKNNSFCGTGIIIFNNGNKYIGQMYISAL